jgi:alpha-galactosidase
LKYDNCFSTGTDVKLRYQAMHDALNASGHPIFFSMCEWGVEDPATWASPVGNSWRTTGDIGPTWNSITKILDQNNQWHEYAGPGGWNDPDMLEVGNGKLTYAEQKSHFTLWCLMKAPLLLGNDLRQMENSTLEIISKSGQDPCLKDMWLWSCSIGHLNLQTLQQCGTILALHPRLSVMFEIYGPVKI